MPRWLRAQLIVFGLIRGREPLGRPRARDVVLSIGLICGLALLLYAALTA